MLELFEASFKRLGIHRIHALVFLVDVGFFVDMKHIHCVGSLCIEIQLIFVDCFGMVEIGKGS